MDLKSLFSHDVRVPDPKGSGNAKQEQADTAGASVGFPSPAVHPGFESPLRHLTSPSMLCCFASRAGLRPIAAMALLVSGPMEASLVFGNFRSSFGRSKRA